MPTELINKVWRVTAWPQDIAAGTNSTARAAANVVNVLGGALGAVVQTVVPAVAVPPTKNGVSSGQQIEITQHRVRFKVERNFTKNPNACDIYVYNLSEDIRAALEQKPLGVQIEAGYNGESRLLFAGDLRFGMSEESGADWVTLLQLGEGSRANASARVSRSYKAGTSYRTIIRDCARSMGFELPANLEDDPALDRQVVTGGVACGPTRDELTRLLAPFGYHWSVQGAELRVLRDEDVVSTGAIPFDEDHGMIGTPTFGSPPKSGKPPNMNAKCFLYAELRPGDLIRLKSRVKDGLFRLERVTHSGDSHSPSDWTTSVELKPY